jgi:DNA invertase Pin-like site-specific DNA recombinase
MAAVAQAERKAISQRTREALRAAKARGVRLGNPNGALALQRAGKGNGAALAAIRARAGQHLADIRPVVAEILGGGSMSLREIAGALNNRGIETARGGRFHAASVRTLLARLNRVTA